MNAPYICFISLYIFYINSMCLWVFVHLHMYHCRKFRNLAATSYRFVFWAGSFHYLKYKGKQATRAEAPILVAASHSTFVDTIVIYLKGPPASVAKAEAASFPIIGSMCAKKYNINHFIIICCGSKNAI